MNKEKLKTMLIVVFILSIILTIPTKVFATDDIIRGGQNFLEAGGDTSPIDEGNLKDVSNIVYNILLAVATVVAVLVGAVLGIQFMMGSMEDQAKVKESLIPFIVGCIIVFGAFGIWKLAATVVQTL